MPPRWALLLPLLVIAADMTLLETLRSALPHVAEDVWKLLPRLTSLPDATLQAVKNNAAARWTKFQANTMGHDTTRPVFCFCAKCDPPNSSVPGKLVTYNTAVSRHWKNHPNQTAPVAYVDAYSMQLVSDAILVARQQGSDTQQPPAANTFEQDAPDDGQFHDPPGFEDGQPEVRLAARCSSAAPRM
jgi:hypothetical protein